MHTPSPRNIKSMYQYSFKNLILFSFINCSFGKTSSSNKYELVSIWLSLLICHVIVIILPLFMHFVTTIRFLSWDYLKSDRYLFRSYTKSLSPLLHLSKTLSFLRLKCSRNCNKFSLFWRFLKLNKIFYIF